MPPSANQLIRLSDVSLVRDRRTILSDISLDVNSGDFLAITGPNGGGKTSLLRIMLRLITPTTGTVTYCSDRGKDSRLHIGYLPQKNMIDSRFPISVRQVVESGLIGLPADNDKSALVDQTIALMGLESRADAPIGNLSGGQLQRTLLGRAIISSPNLLVLDEPLSYVDKAFEQRIYDIISSMSSHTTIVIVSHEMSQISTMASRHIIIDRTLEECSSHHHKFISPCSNQ